MTHFTPIILLIKPRCFLGNIFYIGLYSFVFYVCISSSYAQDKKLTSSESNQGLYSQHTSQKVSTKKVTSSQFSKIGNIKVKAPSQRFSMLRKSNSTNTSNLRSDATVSLRSLYNQHKQISKNARAASSFRGKLVVGNKAAMIKHKARLMSSFKGSMQVAMQKPKGAKSSWTQGQPLKAVVYNKGSLKKGAKVSKSQLANYQKNGGQKLKYNTRESDFMQPDERKVPKGMIENKGK